MSENKKYTAEEAARMVIEHIKDVMKKSEYIGEILEKSKNTAHEIDAGQDPKNDDAECPDYLTDSGVSSEGSQKFKAPSQDKTQMVKAPETKEEADSEEDDEEKKKKKDSEKEDDSEDKYEFKKSEAGMHSIVYKTLAKGRMATDAEKRQLNYDTKNVKYNARQEQIKGTKLDTEHPRHGDEKTPIKNLPQHMPEKMAASEDDGKNNPSFDREKKDKEWTGDQTTMVNATKPGKIKSKRSDQAKFVEEAKKRRAQFRQEGVLKSEDDVKETKGIDFDKKSDSDKKKEEKKVIKRPMEKCGDVKAGKLKKYMSKTAQPSPGMVQKPEEM